MKEGDIVVCIDNKNCVVLVLGQQYKVSYYTPPTNTSIARVNVNGVAFFAYRFRPLNREEKLKRIMK